MPFKHHSHVLVRSRKGGSVPAILAERARAAAAQEASSATGRPGAASLMCCELLDVRTRTVVQENPAIVALGDYILSNNIVSRVRPQKTLYLTLPVRLRTWRRATDPSYGG